MGRIVVVDSFFFVFFEGGQRARAPVLFVGGGSGGMQLRHLPLAACGRRTDEFETRSPGESCSPWNAARGRAMDESGVKHFTADDECEVSPPPPPRSHSLDRFRPGECLRPVQDAKGKSDSDDAGQAGITSRHGTSRFPEAERYPRRIIISLGAPPSRPTSALRAEGRVRRCTVPRPNR